MCEQKLHGKYPKNMHVTWIRKWGGGKKIYGIRKKTKQESREWHTPQYTEPIHIKRTTVSTTAAAIAQRLQMGKGVCVNGELGREGEDKRDREGEREKQRKQAMEVELEGILS